MAVHARQLALKPNLQIIRRSRRPLLRGLEQARRSALAHHVPRIATMGARVLINGTRYKSPSEKIGFMTRRLQQVALAMMRIMAKRMKAARVGSKSRTKRRLRLIQANVLSTNCGTGTARWSASTTRSTWRCASRRDVKQVRRWRSSTRRPPRVLKKGVLARSFRLRRGQEDQRSQAAHPGRYAGSLVERRCSSGRRSGP